ncbi:MAG: universal stress protein [Pirellulales bacterium]
MNAPRILVATDFSRQSAAALDQAAALAEKLHGSLIVAHVAEPPVAYAEGTFYFGLPTVDRAALLEELRKVRPTHSSVACDYRVLEGNAADQLVALAAQEHADYLVLSSHGRTGLTRLLMGSVAEQVVRHAPCPVLVVKPVAQTPAAAAEASAAGGA